MSYLCSWIVAIHILTLSRVLVEGAQETLQDPRRAPELAD